MVFWMVLAILDIIHQFLTSAAFVIYPVFVSWMCETGGGHYDYEAFGKSEPDFYGDNYINYSSGTNCSGSGIYFGLTHVVDKFVWVYLAIGIVVMQSLWVA